MHKLLSPAELKALTSNRYFYLILDLVVILFFLTGKSVRFLYYLYRNLIIPLKTKLLLLFILATGITRSQDVYRTFSGDIAVTITRHDSILMLVSNKLLVTLDYETSKIHFNVGLGSFRTGIDSFDRRLTAIRDTTIEFTGKLGITINSKRYDLQKYNMEGVITTATPPMPVRGNGSMSCIPSGDRLTPACTLLLTMETALSALHLSSVFPDTAEGVRIELRQSILEREKQ